MHKSPSAAGGLRRAPHAMTALESLAPVSFAGSSRLTVKRWRPQPPLPTLASFDGFTGYLGRLNWLFGGR